MLVITANCDGNLADFKAAGPTVFHSLALISLIKSSGVECSNLALGGQHKKMMANEVLR